ncbi:hypothetical protein B0H12DRAFT_1270485 [Mycena haematopus]|nr:hypothetical protein B0H12DRAFT_1270485 [Mycena haematopus]
MQLILLTLLRRRWLLPPPLLLRERNLSPPRLSPPRLSPPPWPYTPSAPTTMTRNKARFVTYNVGTMQGGTANGDFKVAGTGRARFGVRTNGGPPHMVEMEAIHTPDFAMNLISIPRLDRLGLRGEIGDGRLTMRS